MAATRPARAPSASTVAVVWTNPASVLEDYARLLDLADLAEAVPASGDVALALHAPHRGFAPAEATMPWQADAILACLLRAGVARERVRAYVRMPPETPERDGSGVRALRAAVCDKHRASWVDLRGVEWRRVAPRTRLSVLYDVYPDGIDVPAAFVGTPLIHAPPLRAEATVGVAGAAVHALTTHVRGGRYCDPNTLAEAIVDLLIVQREVHRSVCAVIDGTFAGGRAAWTSVRPRAANVAIASADVVAADAVAAKLLGLDPMNVPYLRRAHERGLGVARLEEVEIVGDDISGVNFALAAQLPRRAVRLSALPDGACTSPLRRRYHQWVWRPLKGREWAAELRATSWGATFDGYA